jgi:ATP synthase protein I
VAASKFFPIVRWVLQVQGVSTICFGIAGWIFYDAAHGGSALAGGLIALLPNFLFSLTFGLRQDWRTARQVARRFYMGEVLKLFLTGLLFALALNAPGIQFPALLLGFGLTLSVFWFSLLVRHARS